MLRARRLPVAFSLAIGGLVLAGCSAAPPTVDPSTIHIGDCPAALADSHHEAEEIDVAAANIPALAGVDLAASCAFEGTAIGGDKYYWLYYVTDQTSDVVAYLNAVYAAKGVTSQEAGSTTGGVWDLGTDGNVGAEIGTADGDQDFAFFDGPYIWMFIA